MGTGGVEGGGGGSDFGSLPVYFSYVKKSGLGGPDSLGQIGSSLVEWCGIVAMGGPGCGRVGRTFDCMLPLPEPMT